jgi:hypothetical protein
MNLNSTSSHNTLALPHRKEETVNMMIVVTAAKLLGQPAGHGYDDHVTYRVSGYYPSYFTQGCAQVTPHIIQRHVHDRGVHYFEQCAEDSSDGDDHPPGSVFHQ